MRKIIIKKRLTNMKDDFMGHQLDEPTGFSGGLEQ